MRIAMLTNNYKPFIGGVPISIERLSEGLRSLGHEVYIFAPTYDNQVEEEAVIRYGSFKRKLSKEITVPYLFDSKVEEKIKELEIDLIHVHHPNFVGWMASYLGKKYNIPLVYTYHTRYEQYLHNIKIFNKLEEISKKNDFGLVHGVTTGIVKMIKEKIVPGMIKNYANRCDTVFAPTHLMKDILQETGITSNVEILPTGLNDCFFEPNLDKANKIRKDYIGDKKYLFCTVSRLTKEKNIIFLISGLNKLKKEIGNNFNTLIIGDGPLKKVLQEQVIEMDLEENVTFLNSVPNDEIKDYYSACDLFLFASKSETQGIVLLEAMAAKKPVIAIQASGVIEVVKSGINGYMTGDSIDEWVSQIAYVIKQEGEMEKLKGGAYETAKKYTKQKVAQLAEAYYQESLQTYHQSQTVQIYQEACN